MQVNQLPALQRFRVFACEGAELLEVVEWLQETGWINEDGTMCISKMPAEEVELEDWHCNRPGIVISVIGYPNLAWARMDISFENRDDDAMLFKLRWVD